MEGSSHILGTYQQVDWGESEEQNMELRVTDSSFQRYQGRLVLLCQRCALGMLR